MISVWKHPRLFTEKAIGSIRRKLVRVPEQPMTGLVNGSLRYEFAPLTFLADEDFRAMLTRSYDLTLCRLFRRSLAPGDVVLDVGANVGYVSAMAASYVGTKGEIHGFEPLMPCFERLQVLKALNPQFGFVFQNVALGMEEGVLPISYDPAGESRNASLVPGNTGTVTQNVPVWRLDDYIFKNIPSPERIRLIKIDVEGFEFAVLKGLQEFLKRTPHRPLIVCEIKPWVLPKLGYTTADFDQYLRQFGYASYDMVDWEKRVDVAGLTDMETLLFRIPAKPPDSR